jgi:hypothetical protein
MPKLLIIDKSGTIKELNVKTYVKEELYKKAGFKTADGFELLTTWDINTLNEEDGGKKYFISVYGKKTGRAGQENKYDFPPPIDSLLLFGSCILVNQLEGEEVSSITETEWNKIYEHLFGGFEDIGSEDSDVSEEEDEDEAMPKTKTGYAKDGFVVDDCIEGESTEEEEGEEESVDSVPLKGKKVPKWAEKKTVSQSKSDVKKRKPTLFDKIETTQEEEKTLECSDELEEEEYL